MVSFGIDWFEQILVLHLMNYKGVPSRNTPSRKHSGMCAEIANWLESCQLTSVDIHGDKLSPLYWSLRDGNFPMVQFIIEDLLAIRKFMFST